MPLAGFLIIDGTQIAIIDWREEMAQLIVVADDLTGANATGVQLSRLGFQAQTHMGELSIELFNSCAAEILLAQTDSRAVTQEEAYSRVFRAVSSIKDAPVKFFSKRIDSTLRGNLGSETDAFLDALNNEALAVVVPCFPSAGRVLAGGHLLVHGVPLYATEAGNDPKNPMNTSDAAEVFRRQSKYRVASLTLNDLKRGKQHLISELKNMKSEKVRTVIMDCLSEEDVKLIADAVIESRLPFIAVDPGVFTAVLASRLLQKNIPPRQHGRVLVVIGSINPVVRDQLYYMFACQRIFNVYVRTEEFLKGDKAYKDEVERALDEYISADTMDYAVASIVGDGIKPENRIDFSRYSKHLDVNPDDLAALVASGITEIAEKVLRKDSSFGALYTSGGDISVALYRRLGADGLLLHEEVVPLAAAGTLNGGDFCGLGVVTKGGMVGDSGAMDACVRYLLSGRKYLKS